MVLSYRSRAIDTKGHDAVSSQWFRFGVTGIASWMSDQAAPPIKLKGAVRRAESKCAIVGGGQSKRKGAAMSAG